MATRNCRKSLSIRKRQGPTTGFLMTALSLMQGEISGESR
ncbi:MAG: hypothetical protein ACI92S_003156 [Planctomycetaceae bacterium]